MFYDVKWTKIHVTSFKLIIKVCDNSYNCLVFIKNTSFWAFRMSQLNTKGKLDVKKTSLIEPTAGLAWLLPCENYLSIASGRHVSFVSFVSFVSLQ